MIERLDMCGRKDDLSNWNCPWVFEKDGHNYVLARCGVWRAVLAYTVYSKGQVRLETSDANQPTYLGQERTSIREGGNLMRLIDEVSKAMVEALPNSAMVYLASLNESKTGLHFWLVPRNRSEHQEFLDQEDECGRINDGFALLAHLRRSFLCRQRLNEWGDMIPPPDDGSHPQWKEVWCKYADDYFDMFRQWWQKRDGSRL